MSPRAWGQKDCQPVDSEWSADVRAWLWASLLAVVFSGTIALVALAHEVKMPDGSAVDYSGLKQHDGVRSCCGQKDCQPVDSEWRADGLWIDLGEPWRWVLAPPYKIMMPLINPPGAADWTHACWDHDRKDQLLIYCVFPSSTGS
jgi:hypothetical protein